MERREPTFEHEHAPWERRLNIVYAIGMTAVVAAAIWLFETGSLTLATAACIRASAGIAPKPSATVAMSAISKSALSDKARGRGRVFHSSDTKMLLVKMSEKPVLLTRASLPPAGML